MNCAGQVGPVRWFIHGAVCAIPVTLSYFILAVPVRGYLGGYSCMISTFPVDIHTPSFSQTVGLQVHGVCSGR